MANDAFLAGFQARSDKQTADKKAKAGAAKTSSDATGQSGTASSTFRDKLAKLFPSKRKGGPVRKTGLFLLHSGEFVVPAKPARRKVSSGKRHSAIVP